MSSSRRGRRAARRVAWAAALGLAAAAAPPALANGGAADVAASPLPDVAQMAAEILEDVSLEEPTAALPVELPVELPAATLDPAAEEPASAGAAAAPPPQPVSAPTPDPAPEAAPAPQPEEPPTPDAPAIQTDPTNVNVSIRVESPGDDGAVTQTNAAADQYQSAEPQYQPVVAGPEAPTAAASEESAPAPDAGTPAADATAGSWDWSWSWDCGSAPAGPVGPPAGAPVQNWNWNWEWNCGGKDPPPVNSPPKSGEGYQQPVMQYRPVNINVSIRINSPGNNGPVTQTNVAVALAVPQLAGVLPGLSPPPPGPAPPAAAAPAPSGAAEGDEDESVFGLGFDAIASVAVFTLVERRAELLWPVGSGFTGRLLQQPRGFAYAPERPALVRAGGTATTAGGIAVLPGDSVAVAARLEARARSAATAAATPRAQARAARPAPSSARGHHDSDEVPAAAPQTGLGLGAVGGPERTLPFAALMPLALVFAFALSSLASVRARPSRGVDAEPPESPG